MRNIIHHITRPVIVYGAMGVALIIVSGIIGWPYMISHYGMFWAIVFMSLSVVFAVIFAYGFAGHTHLGLKHRHIDLRAYERERLLPQQQTPLPYQQQVSTKITEDIIPTPQKRLQHGSRRRLKLHRANPQIANRSGANLHLADLQKPFATGYRPPSSAVANPQPANLQIADDTDERIAEAAKILISRNEKATGIAIADMTGIAERTVYDRIAKMRKGGQL